MSTRTTTTTTTTTKKPITITVRCCGSHQTAAAAAADHRAVLEAAAHGDLLSLKTFDADAVRAARCATGCTALHWAAGGDHVAVCRYLIETIQMSPNVQCTGRAAGRTPLHYAARNGRLNAAQYLIREAGADPHTTARHGVSPFQLAAFQNQLAMMRWMVEECHVVAAQERNDFDCNTAHWLAICPRRDTDLIATAEWLLSQGCDFKLQQKQGHSAFHKAAWKGHLPLLRWMHTVLDVWDDQPDAAGNYAADLARMGGHVEVVEYLRRHCGRDRAASCRVLGIAVEDAGCAPTVRRAYLRQARRCHPDRQLLQQRQRRQCNDEKKQKKNASSSNCESSSSNDDDDTNNSNNSSMDFDALRRAYHHLTVEEGRGTQHNPAHSLKLLLREAQQPQQPPLDDNDTKEQGNDVAKEQDDDGEDIKKEDEDDAEGDSTRYLKARLTAVLLEFGDKGVNVCNLPKKWLQVWGPDVAFPFSKKRQLTHALRTECADVVELRQCPRTHSYRAHLKQSDNAARLQSALRRQHATTTTADGDGKEENGCQ